MKSTLVRHRDTAALITLIFVGVLIALTVKTSQTEAQTDSWRDAIVVEEMMGPVTYRIVHAEGAHYESYVEFPALPNQTTLDQYVKLTTDAAPGLFKLQTDVEALIVFRRPLQEDELPHAIPAHVERVRGYTFRWRGVHGERVGIFGTPSKEAFISRDMLASQVDSTRRMAGEGDLKGLMVVQMRVNQTLYDELRAHPEVYIVDIGPAIAAQKTREANLLRSGDITDSQWAPIFWYLEDLQTESE